MKYSNRVDCVDFRSKFDLTGKVIVIGGGYGLIGRAFVEAVLQFGANPVIVDVEEEGVNAFCAGLQKRYQKNVLNFKANVVKEDDIKIVLSKTLEQYNRIDGLVNCQQYKGGNFFARFEDYAASDWDAVVETNLKGTFITCQIIGGWMADNNGGCIVNMPSVYSVVAPNQNLYNNTSIGCPASYSASKGGVEALSKYLAAYWGQKAVRVNMITPHGVWNEHEKQFETNFSKFLPLGRLSSNHEVAGALIYLLSDASSFVTGHNLIVDGGWTVW